MFWVIGGLFVLSVLTVAYSIAFKNSAKMEMTTIKMEQRSMEEMLEYLGDTINEMDIRLADKMVLFGIITAICQKYFDERRE